MCIPISPLTDRQSLQEYFTRNSTIVVNNSNNKCSQNVKQINNYSNAKNSTIQIQKKLLVKMGNKRLDFMKLKQQNNINEDSISIISRNKLGFKSIKVPNNNSLHLASRNEMGNEWKRKSCQNKSNGHSSYKLSPKSRIKDVKGLSIYNFSKLFNVSLTKLKNKCSVDKGKVYKLKSE